MSTFVATRQHDLHCFRIPMAAYKEPRLHRHRSHEFYFCATGGGHQHTSAGRWPMQQGQLWLFPGGVEHIGTGGDDGTTLGIVLSADPRAARGGADDDTAGLLKRLTELHPAEHPLIDVTPATSQIITGLINACADECRDRQPGFRAAVRARFLDLIASLARDPLLGPRLRPAVQPPSDHERIAQAVRFLEVHYRRPITIAELCHISGLGRSQLHALCKRALGHGPVEHLAQLRIAEAQRQLLDGERDVLAIALDVGYGSLSHFYRQFSRIVGCAPATWAETQATGSPTRQY